MAETKKVLGQSNPAATTLTTLYTVPAATEAIVSSLVVCNQSTATTFRVVVSVAGAAINAKQYLCFDSAIDANETLTFTLGITLAATDVVKVYAGTTSLSFNLFGVEIA